MGICAIEGCKNEEVIRGYCQTCYNKLWRAGVLPDRKDKEQSVKLPETVWKRRSESVRKQKTVNTIRLSYNNYTKNYDLCTSLEMRLYWSKKLRDCMKEAERLGLEKEDIRLTPEEEEVLIDDLSEKEY